MIVMGGYKYFGIIIFFIFFLISTAIANPQLPPSSPSPPSNSTVPSSNTTNNTTTGNHTNPHPDHGPQNHHYHSSINPRNRRNRAQLFSTRRSADLCTHVLRG
ncbi:hypothetical protein B9Z19DRAFT_1096804 [Tuber borchii]|uniref:Uncharacterized protein n=1 Tax=Tuber borchii TaxID=42251 RepID=A0A2T6ZB21_TUBBO|nr:hypothetical protein B9Z19DRAFT_1096804 [Tuber borchii]